MKPLLLSILRICEKTNSMRWFSKKTSVANASQPRRNHIATTSQMSRFLCVHKILVHAQHSCACTTLLCMHWAREPRGQGPSQGPGTRPLAWSLAPGSPGPLHAQECCACTRVLCMDKNLAHAQKSCACIMRIKYVLCV